MLFKVCSKCKVNKPHSDYFKDNKREIGIRCKCKTCCKDETQKWREKNQSEYNNYVARWRAKNKEKQHATELKRNYGITIDEYRRLLQSQGDCCAICSKPHDPTRSRARLYVDHCHNSKRVRGLLCGKCNSGIGYLNHDIAILSRAIEYLR